MALSVSCILELVATLDVAVTLLKKKDFLTALCIMNEKHVLRHHHNYNSTTLSNRMHR